MLEDSYGSYIVACEEDLLGGWGFLLPFPSSPPPTPKRVCLQATYLVPLFTHAPPPSAGGGGMPAIV